MLNLIKRLFAPQAFKIEGIYMAPDDYRIIRKGQSKHIHPTEMSNLLRGIADIIDARGGF